MDMREKVREALYPHINVGNGACACDDDPKNFDVRLAVAAEAAMGAVLDALVDGGNISVYEALILSK